MTDFFIASELTNVFVGSDNCLPELIDVFVSTGVSAPELSWKLGHKMSTLFT